MKITVFTSTYNRSYIIDNLYSSLKQQTFSDFEWLVIDDGSTDGTEDYFKRLAGSETQFEIKYFKSQNLGKQKQINRGLDLATGDLFFNVDSDDMLTENALSLVNQWAESVSPEKGYCGVAGNYADLSGNLTNPIFSNQYLDATFFDRDPQSPNFIGYDRAWIFFTDVHRKYKYPEFKNEKFITEAVVWNRMAADGLKIRCFNQPIYLWEYQSDGYTSKIKKILHSNPYGYGLWVNELLRFTRKTNFEKIKAYYAFYVEFRAERSLTEVANYLQVPVTRILLFPNIYSLKRILKK